MINTNMLRPVLIAVFLFLSPALSASKDHKPGRSTEFVRPASDFTQDDCSHVESRSSKIHVDQIVAVKLDVLSDSYAKFIEDLRAELIGADPAGKVKQRPILAKQTGKEQPPPKWIEVELVGKGGANPKVAIRSDNVYVFAFTNADGNWYKLTEAKTAVLPDAAPLGFEGNYNKLVGGSTNLANLKFGKFSTSSAAVILWNHKKKPYVDAELKRALATICVVLSEAARLAPVYNAVNGGWETQAGGTIKAEDIKYYINGWSDLSKQLQSWKHDNYNNDDKWFGQFMEAGIHSGEEALKVVELLLNETQKLGLLAWLKQHLWGLRVKKIDQ